MTRSRSTPIRGQSSREVQPDPTEIVVSTDDDRNDAQPLSIAEEFSRQGSGQQAEPPEQYADLDEGEVYLTELKRMSMSELIEAGREEQVADSAGMKRQELIFNILKERVKTNGMMYGEGTLEILPDGFGFLRSADYHYLSCPDDIYVSPSQIRDRKSVV